MISAEKNYLKNAKMQVNRLDIFYWHWKQNQQIKNIMNMP